MTVADPQAKHYIHKDLSLPPLTEFQVKVKAFNSKGEGPFSLTAVIYSALDGEHQRASRLSAQSCEEENMPTTSQSDVTDQRGPVSSLSASSPALGCLNLSMPATYHHQVFPLESDPSNWAFSCIAVRNFNTPWEYTHPLHVRPFPLQDGEVGGWIIMIYVARTRKLIIPPRMQSI